MKLSEIKGQEAIDVLAELITPVSDIFSDKKVADLLRGGNKIKAIQAMLKEHSKSVIEMLAILEREDPKTYEPSLLSLPVKLLELLNDPELQMLFPSQGQTMEKTSSGSATENTEADQK